jgi:hypothetical protein
MTGEIRRLHTHTCIDQHLSRFDAIGFDGHSGHHGADAGEHLAANLPRVVASTPRVGHLGAGEFAADGIDQLTGHRIHATMTVEPTSQG